MQPMHTAQKEAGQKLHFNTTFKSQNHSFQFLKAVSEKKASLNVLVSNSVRKLKNSRKLLNCVDDFFPAVDKIGFKVKRPE